MEVNCETDFVARSDDFCDLVELLCMQLTVFPDLRFISATQVCAAFPAPQLCVAIQPCAQPAAPAAGLVWGSWGLS